MSSSNGSNKAAIESRVNELLELTHEGMRIMLSLPLDQLSNSGCAQPSVLTLSSVIPLQLKRRGVELRMVLVGKPAANGRVDRPLLRAVARARRWTRDLVSARAGAVRELARQENIDVSIAAALAAARIPLPADRRSHRRRPSATRSHHRTLHSPP